MHIPFPRLRQPVLLGVLITGGVLSIGIGTWLTFRASVTAARYVPADRTIALFENVNDNSIAAFRPLFPLLESAPKSSSSYDLAIIEMEEGVHEWAIFYKGSDDAHTMALGPYRVLTSSPAVQTMLRDKTKERLRDADFFRSLRHRDDESSQVFFDVTAFPIVNDALPALTKTATHGSILLTASGTSLSALLPESEESLPPLGTSIPLHLHNAFAVIALAEPLTVMEYLGNDTTMLSPLLNTWVAEFFGPDVSLQHDLLPMVERDATLALARRSGSGEGIIFVLEGTGGSAQIVEDKFTRLFPSLQNTLASSDVIRRELDGSFRSTLIRTTESALDAQKFRANGWHAMTAGETGGRGVFVARRGIEVIISNDINAGKAALDAVIDRGSSEMPLPHAPGGQLPLAGGRMERETLQSLLHPSLHSLLPASPNMRFSIEQADGVLTLTVAPDR